MEFLDRVGTDLEVAAEHHHGHAACAEEFADRQAVHRPQTPGAPTDGVKIWRLPKDVDKEESKLRDGTYNLIFHHL